MKWGDKHYAPDGPPRLTLHRDCGGEVGADMVCERCGEHVKQRAIQLAAGPGSANVNTAGQGSGSTAAAGIGTVLGPIAPR